MAGKNRSTKLSGVPSEADMRRARQRQRFFVVSDVNGATDSEIEDIGDIGACRAAIENIAAARELAPRRGRPLDKDQLLAALTALEETRTPLLDYKDGAAAKVIADKLNLTQETGYSILRRLLDLRKRVTGKEAKNKNQKK
jgi:hypothetical protein